MLFKASLLTLLLLACDQVYPEEVNSVESTTPSSDTVATCGQIGTVCCSDGCIDSAVCVQHQLLNGLIVFKCDHCGSSQEYCCPTGIECRNNTTKTPIGMCGQYGCWITCGCK